MVQPTEDTPNVAFERLLSLRLAVKKNLERNLLAFDDGSGGRMQHPLLLLGPPGDIFLFDLSQSLMHCCHEESKRTLAFSC